MGLVYLSIILSLHHVTGDTETYNFFAICDVDQTPSSYIAVTRQLTARYESEVFFSQANGWLGVLHIHFDSISRHLMSNLTVSIRTWVIINHLLP